MADVPDLHFLQKELLKKLIFAPEGLRFKDLIIPNLGSDLLNYHLKTLVRRGFVEKDIKQGYRLSGAGKIYVNSLDKSNIFIEPMAQTCVIIHGIREREGRLEQLFCRRLLQPYYGKLSRITGKVHYGEDFEAAARRKLLEKTGLQAENFTLERIYHKIGTDREGNVLQDVIFYIYFVTGFSGTLLERTESQENFWITNEELLSDPAKYDLFQDQNLNERRKPLAQIEYKETRLVVEGF